MLGFSLGTAFHWVVDNAQMEPEACDAATYASPHIEPASVGVPCVACLAVRRQGTVGEDRQMLLRLHDVAHGPPEPAYKLVAIRTGNDLPIRVAP